MPGICLSMADAPQELAALSHYWALIRREFGQQLAGREQTLALLAQAVSTFMGQSLPVLAPLLTDHGMALIDDCHNLKESRAYPYPRPAGKATLIFPMVVSLLCFSLGYRCGWRPRQPRFSSPSG
jgi:hypothetical protein